MIKLKSQTFNLA